jgi:hypothetical protein
VDRDEWAGGHGRAPVLSAVESGPGHPEFDAFVEGLHHANAAVGHGPAERGAPFRVSVANQDAMATEHAVICVGQHTSDLAHEGVIWMRGRAHEMHASRFQFDDEKRVVRHQPANGPDLGGEEIRGRDRVPVGGQKRTPLHRPLRYGANPVGSYDGGDRGPSDAMAEVPQGTLDPAVAPCRILTRHPDGQLTDLAEYARSSDASVRNGPCPRDQLLMPSQESVWCDQRCHVTQDLSSEAVAVHSESAALDVGQPQSPAVEVLFEDAVLFPQVLDHLKLVAIHPARERHEENLQPNGLDHEPSLSAAASALPAFTRLNFRIVRPWSFSSTYTIAMVFSVAVSASCRVEWQRKTSYVFMRPFGD